MQPSWTGRTDGTTPEHLRWHQVVRPYGPGVEPGACVFVGFASDEGVRRNKGRVGAAAGPDALRQALAPMALAQPHLAYDAGTVTVRDGRLEEGQRALGATITGVLDAGHFPVVLGGGHEIAYGTYLGVAGSRRATAAGRIGILNLDAHFDLRADAVPSSGTPFRQILEADGDSVRYAVLGISQPSNTAALFDTAAKYNVRYLLDDDCEQERALAFVDDFVADIDLLYLTIDLDVLPAAVAPGVSAPAAFGIPLSTIQAVCDRVTACGKLAVVDVAELNPGLDIDNRTARTAARLIHRIVTGHVPSRPAGDHQK
ncbi:formimidoylglutamase [Nocardia cyriacigeorgica]|uniref:formimidoylglutamase n=1 Tax=Nocardia cyriacigeorgica TaxID=135487 RepID=UPI001893D807|nr:formimidoylglutamase [Nocardia cyriacigeorgica]MBF6087702.1 formimidoylglutamase [Nocardia cyriacigeorgica]MBF6396943.1 formimidoylglutamase [Nocardia cyriacigeorgica]MBF6403399.1 formimidoylglutamase [Nocardia cyriacigeorgica]